MLFLQNQLYETKLLLNGMNLKLQCPVLAGMCLQVGLALLRFMLGQEANLMDRGRKIFWYSERKPIINYLFNWENNGKFGMV